MARTALTPVVAPGTLAAAGLAAAFTAADVANGNKFASSGNELLIAYNSNASSTAHAVTISSVADPYGRLGDITSESIAAGAYRIYGPFKKNGWVQSDGSINVSADHAEVKFLVVTLP